MLSRLLARRHVSQPQADFLKLIDPILQFIGDIHQPLHDENLDVGGNDIDVTFDGASTNLHAIVRFP